MLEADDRRLRAPRRAARLAFLTLVCVLLLTAPGAASTSQVMSFEAPEELLDDTRRDRTLDEIRAMGVTRVRVLVQWRRFAAQPERRAHPAFDTRDPDAYPSGIWAPLDHLVAGTELRGMDVQLTLTGPVPTWATARRKGHLRRPSPRAFSHWVEAVGRRFGDRVDLWSIWNEPNHPGFLLPQYERGKPVSPQLYRRLYVAAERALHGLPGGDRDIVLFGETAPVGNVHVVAPLAFLRGALCTRSARCRRLRMDGYAHHAYTRRSGPLSRFGARDEVSIGTLHRLERALDRAARERAIDRRPGIYLTEFGIQSKPDPIAGVSLLRQAEYLAIAEHMAYVNPRVRSFSQYLMNDDQPRQGGGLFGRYAGFETGLRTARGAKKPAYAGFILPLRVMRFGSNDVLWGRVRPATGATTVQIERRVGRRWTRVSTLTTSARGVFGGRVPHRAGARYRVHWQRPGASALRGPAIRPY